MRRDRTVLQRHEGTEQQLQEEIQRRLAIAPAGEVLPFVHGFNETFATAAYTAPDLCHFLGRSHVCALFTWPASAGRNPLVSYEKTTESAQYSVGHLRKAIRTIARTPGVRGIQLLAHSRGAAVALMAFRELSIEAIAAGVEPAEALQLDNLVLLSPDVDSDVASQQPAIFASDPGMTARWFEGRLPQFLRGRFTVYSPVALQTGPAAVEPTFEWIRVAKRVPVRVHLDSMPESVELRVGTTASVLVMTGDTEPREAPPVPAALR